MNLLNDISLDAQCSSHHVYPIYVGLMQVHGWRQGTPVLKLARDLISLKRMQNHLPFAWLLQEKSRILGGLNSLQTV